MRIELDVSLENPAETINLTQVEKILLSSSSYKLLQHKSNNYLLLQNIHEDFKIRVHADGRIYVKIDIALVKNTSEKNILENLFKQLKDFLNRIHFINHGTLKNEINFSFYGNTAHSFFWEKYDELNQIGKKVLTVYDLRTYAQDDDSIYVKLESSNPLNMEACCAGTQE